MNNETKELLSRWYSLESGDGLHKARTMARALQAIGFLLAVAIALGISYKVHPGVIAAMAAVTGWVLAERNALVSRATQWPVFRAYVDWERVRKDLGGKG